MPFPASAGNDLPFSKDKNDLSILSVRESTSGHEIEQTPFATGFQAYVFESKLDTLTNSMLKMSDSLACLKSFAWGSPNSRGRRCYPRRRWTE